MGSMGWTPSKPNDELFNTNKAQTTFSTAITDCTICPGKHWRIAGLVVSSVTSTADFCRAKVSPISIEATTRRPQVNFRGYSVGCRSWTTSEQHWLLERVPPHTTTTGDFIVAKSEISLPIPVQSLPCIRISSAKQTTQWFVVEIIEWLV